MAATIRFRDGTKATLLSERNEWICDVPHLKRLLERTYEELPYAYYINPITEIANAVAKILYAEVIHLDPEDNRADDDPHKAY